MLTERLRRLADEHIESLCRRHHIRVRRTRRWETSEVDLVFRQVFIPKVTRTAMDYLASLHEIGHLVDPAARGAQRRWSATASERDGGYELLVEEATAWAWAVRNARPVILKAMTKTDWRNVGKSWVSYAGDVW